MPRFVFSKGKKHWLTIQYKKPDGKEDFVFLRMDKNNYQMIISSLEAATGQTIERIMED